MLSGLPGSMESFALGINDGGQVVGESIVGGVAYAVEWSGGSAVNLGALPGRDVPQNLIVWEQKAFLRSAVTPKTS
jgi:probable HAF family extracellular repeat protein